MKLSIIITLIFLNINCSGQSTIVKQLNKINLFDRAGNDFVLLQDAYNTIADSIDNIEIYDLSYWLFKEKMYFEIYKKDSIPLRGVDNSIYRMTYSFGHSMLLEIYERWVYDFRALKKYKSGDYNGALSDYINSIGSIDDAPVSETGAIALYNIGLCYFNLHDLNNSCKCMSKAGDYGNKNAYEFIKNNCSFITK